MEKKRIVCICRVLRQLVQDELELPAAPSADGESVEESAFRMTKMWMSLSTTEGSNPTTAAAPTGITILE